MKKQAQSGWFSKGRGFTLIELLVVIAIIGILAAVVMASLGNARKSGNEAALKQTLSSVRSQAEIHYLKNGFAYTDFCDSLNSGRENFALGQSIKKNSYAHEDPACNATPTDWYLSALISREAGEVKFWCVDSTGWAGLLTVSEGHYYYVVNIVEPEECHAFTVIWS